MLESYIFRQMSAKLLSKTKAAPLLRLSFRLGQFCKSLSATISKEDLSQSVGELITWLYIDLQLKT